MRISDWSSDVCSSDLKASAAPAAQLRGRTRLIRPPEKSQLCGIVIYAKACAEGSCNLNYKKEQERGNRKLGMSESTLCQMDRSSPRERRQSAILDDAESLFLEQDRKSVV